MTSLMQTAGHKLVALTVVFREFETLISIATNRVKIRVKNFCLYFIYFFIGGGGGGGAREGGHS